MVAKNNGDNGNHALVLVLVMVIITIDCSGDSDNINKMWYYWKCLQSYNSKNDDNDISDSVKSNGNKDDNNNTIL